MRNSTQGCNGAKTQRIKEVIPRALTSTPEASLMDLLVRHGAVRLALELKVWRDGVKDPLAEGLEQPDSYLNGLGLSTGWLVIFDQRSGLLDIAERLTAAPVATPAGRTVTLVHA